MIDIIRKYNLRLNELKKNQALKLKSKSFSNEEIQVLTVEINSCEDFLKDLYFINAQMPAINPIPKGGYNDAPEGLKEITLEEWQRGMFHYCIFESDSKQVRNDGKVFDLRLFDVPNFDNKKLGYAVMHDWFDVEKGKNRPKAIIRFCRYGKDEDWTSFENRFASQFSGDNS